MDPMGDVGASGGDNTQAAASLDATTGAHNNLKSNEIVDPLIVQMNLSSIERIRSVMGIASGCIAGILGLTGMEGFGTCRDPDMLILIYFFGTHAANFFSSISIKVCFTILHLLISFAIWSYKLNCNLRAYTQLSWFKYLITVPLQPTALSFTLFWTLFYGLVFLY